MRTGGRKEGNRRRTARVGDIAEVADTGKVGTCREEVIDVLVRREMISFAPWLPKGFVGAR